MFNSRLFGPILVAWAANVVAALIRAEKLTRSKPAGNQGRTSRWERGSGSSYGATFFSFRRELAHQWAPKSQLKRKPGRYWIVKCRLCCWNDTVIQHVSSHCATDTSVNLSINTADIYKLRIRFPIQRGLWNKHGNKSPSEIGRAWKGNGAGCDLTRPSNTRHFC